MNLRDMVFLTAGFVIALAGTVMTIVWRLEAGIVALLAMSVLLLVLLVLQRRQLARVQQRTLDLLNASQPEHSVRTLQKPDPSVIRKDLAISTKKIVGLLQAQQIGLELLNQKISQRSGEKTDSNSPT